MTRRRFCTWSPVLTRLPPHSCPRRWWRPQRCRLNWTCRPTIWTTCLGSTTTHIATSCWIGACASSATTCVPVGGSNDTLPPARPDPVLPHRGSERMLMNLTATILSVVLAVGFLGSGALKLIGNKTSLQMRDAVAVGAQLWRAIGALEVAAAVGLLVGLAVPAAGIAPAAGLSLPAVRAIVGHPPAHHAPHTATAAPPLGPPP